MRVEYLGFDGPEVAAFSLVSLPCPGSGFRVLRGIMVPGFGFRVSGFDFGVSGFGFKVSG